MDRIPRKMGVPHWREISSLAAPTVLTTLSHTLMWTVDIAFLGHVSSLALAAAGLGGMITWTAYSLFNNLSRITSTFISQANGEGNDRAAADYTWQGLYVAGAAGVFLTLGGFVSDRILPLTGIAPDLQAATYIYIKYRTMSALGTQVTLCLSGFFQGRKDVKTPMVAGILANGLNVLLDYVLIFGWDGMMIAGARRWAVAPMGVKGAAIATSVSVFANAGILGGIILASGEIRTRYRLVRPRPLSARQAGDLLRIGIPSSIDTFIDMLGFTVFSALIGRVGATSLAASQITIQLLAFSFMPMSGITIAGTVLVGNLIGAKEMARAKRYADELLLVSLYYTLFLAGTIALVGRPLFSVFTEDPEVLRFAGLLALLAAGFQLFDGLRMITVGILQGAGDTRFPMWLSVVVLGGFFMPGTYVMTVVRGGGVIHAWVIGVVSYVVMAAGLYGRYRTNAWMRIRIFSEPALASSRGRSRGSTP